MEEIVVSSPVSVGTTNSGNEKVILFFLIPLFFLGISDWLDYGGIVAKKQSQ